MSRRRAGLSPSLFPFLAVLICTLGTLILLLALVAQEAKQVAEQKAAESERTAKPPAKDIAVSPIPKTLLSVPTIDDSKPKLTADEAGRRLEEQQFRVSELVSHRTKQTSEVERRRDELTHVEASVRELREKIKRLGDEVTAAVSPETELKLDEKTLVLMQDEMEALRGEIAELEEAKRGEKPRVVIVPHRGPNGTQRRPVYVECTRDGVTIWPEGVQISQTQLVASVQAKNSWANSLDSALRVVRRHAMRQYGDKVPPYPLLVVRPDGIETYIVARAAMADWDDQYGYELVPSEVELAFPEPDSVLRHDIELAVHEAKALNPGIASTGLGGGGGSGQGTRGSFGMDRASGRPPGTSVPQERTGSISRSDADRSNRTSSPTGAVRENQLAGTSSSERPRKPLPTLSARSLDQQAQSNGFKMPRDLRYENPVSAMGASVPGSSEGRFGASNEIQSQSQALDDYLNGNLSDPLAPKLTPPTPNPLAGSPPGEFNEHGSPTHDVASSTHLQNPSQQDRTGQMQSGQMQSGQMQSGQMQSGQMQPGQAGSNQSAARQSQQANQTNSHDAQSSQAHGHAAAPSVSQSASAPPPGAQPGQSASAPPPGPPPQDPPPGQASAQLVRREGNNWAMPSSMRGMQGTEVVRPISIRCHHDRYEILHQGRIAQVFDFRTDGVYRATLKLATAVRGRVDSWGATLPGGYWQPRLDVSVGPHADQRFHELQTLMQGSGVDVVRRSP